VRARGRAASELTRPAPAETVVLTPAMQRVLSQIQADPTTQAAAVCLGLHSGWASQLTGQRAPAGGIRCVRCRARRACCRRRARRTGGSAGSEARTA
jgi:hypothetical protein